MTMKPHVQALCNRLIANDPSFTDHNIYLDDDDDDEDESDYDDLALVFKATKNKLLSRIKKLSINHGA
jgi:hypothetical protein